MKYTLMSTQHPHSPISQFKHKQTLHNREEQLEEEEDEAKAIIITEDELEDSEEDALEYEDEDEDEDESMMMMDPQLQHPIDALLTLILLPMINVCVECYLTTVIAPFLTWHERFYSRLNYYLKQGIQRLEDQGNMPHWLTANFVTYARTVLVFPALVLLSLSMSNHHGLLYAIMAALIVILVDFGDFLDGVLARYWKEEASALDDSSSSSSQDNKQRIVQLQSFKSMHIQQAYGGFVDAVCDKAFVVPMWIFMLSTIAHKDSYDDSSMFYIMAQYMVLFSLILTETTSGVIRFRAYFLTLAVKVPLVKGLETEFSSSAVKADHIGKAKQSFEMLGTAFFVIPLLPFRIMGLLLLSTAVPLAYESVRRKITTRAMYVQYTYSDIAALDHRTLSFWMQAKSMGSKLIVGVECKDVEDDAVLNARSVPCVDDVIVIRNTSKSKGKKKMRVDMAFMKKYQLDYVVCQPNQNNYIGLDVMKAGNCLEINSETGIAQPICKREKFMKTD